MDKEIITEIKSPTKNPFRAVPLDNPGLFDRLRHRLPIQNALKEVNNLLAGDIISITYDSIDEINGRYETDVREKFRDDFAGYYQQYLEYSLADNGLSEGPRDELRHIKAILGLNEHTTAEIQTSVVCRRFETRVTQAFASASGPITKDQLFAQAAALGLTQDETDRIYSSHAKANLDRALDALIEDQRWSPDEEQHFITLARNLGISPSFEPDTRTMLDRFRLYWNIEEGELPAVDVDIHLQRNEVAYFAANADWFEYRTQTKRINYGGPTARVKIAKGVYWRMGSVGVQRVTEEVMQHIDSGALYITNKRIIFVGGRKNTNVRLNRILDFTIHQNGIEVVKDSGRSPFLALDANVDVCALVLDRVLRDQ